MPILDFSVDLRCTRCKTKLRTTEALAAEQFVVRHAGSCGPRKGFDEPPIFKPTK